MATCLVGDGNASNACNLNMNITTRDNKKYKLATVA